MGSVVFEDSAHRIAPVMDEPIEPLERLRGEGTPGEQAGHECEPSLPTGKGRATGFCYDERMCLHEVRTVHR
jgi:hypothetical protein